MKAWLGVMEPTNPAADIELNEEDLDALLEAELAEIASTASSTPPASPVEFRQRSASTYDGEHAAEEEDYDTRSIVSNSTLAEAWEHLHLAHETRHQQAEQFEKDFQELLGLAHYVAQVDPVVRVVVGEIIDKLEDANFAAVNEPNKNIPPAFTESPSPRRPVGETLVTQTVGITQNNISTENESKENITHHMIHSLEPRTLGSDNAFQQQIQNDKSDTACFEHPSERVDGEFAVYNEEMPEKTNQTRTKTKTAYKPQTSDSMHADFLSSLEAEIAAREKERLDTMKEIERERAAQKAALELLWAQDGACQRIGRVWRGYKCRQDSKRRLKAIAIIQRSIRFFAAKIFTIRLREQRRLEKQHMEDRRQMHLEDELARQRRALLWEEWSLMEREDSLAQAIRLCESVEQAKAREGMFLEDKYATELRTKEREIQVHEHRGMEMEDRVAHLIRSLNLLDQQGMEQEDEASYEWRESQSKLLQLATVGSTVHLSRKQLYDLRDAKAAKLNVIRSFIAEENNFSKLYFVVHQDVLSGLVSLHLARNELTDLRSLPACAETLEVLDISGNRLRACDLHHIRHLRRIRSLNLSGNPLKFFDGKVVLSDNSPLQRLSLASCDLVNQPVNVIGANIRFLDLSGNLLDGPALLDASCMLPELQELNLSNNPLRKLRHRSAHLCPGLQRLDCRDVKTSEQDLVEALLEHIHLTEIELGSRTLTKSAVMYICRYLRRLKTVNGDPWFRQKVFEEEIVQLQASVRGALKREQIRIALEKSRSGFGEDEIDGEFASVDINDFIPQLEDDDLELDPEVSPSSSPLFDPGHHQQVKSYHDGAAANIGEAQRNQKVEHSPNSTQDFPGRTSKPQTVANGNTGAQFDIGFAMPRANISVQNQTAFHSVHKRDTDANISSFKSSGRSYNNKEDLFELPQSLDSACQPFNGGSVGVKHQIYSKFESLHNNIEGHQGFPVDDQQLQQLQQHEQKAFQRSNDKPGQLTPQPPMNSAPEAQRFHTTFCKEMQEKHIYGERQGCQGELLVQSARSTLSQRSRTEEDLDEGSGSFADPTRGYSKMVKKSQQKKAGKSKKTRQNQELEKPRSSFNFLSVNRRDRQQLLLKRPRKLIPAWARKGKEESTSS